VLRPGVRSFSEGAINLDVKLTRKKSMNNKGKENGGVEGGGGGGGGYNFLYKNKKARGACAPDNSLRRS
jgi:hypothetical protein